MNISLLKNEQTSSESNMNYSGLVVGDTISVSSKIVGIGKPWALSDDSNPQLPQEFEEGLSSVRVTDDDENNLAHDEFNLENDLLDTLQVSNFVIFSHLLIRIV